MPHKKPDIFWLSIPLPNGDQSTSGLWHEVLRVGEFSHPAKGWTLGVTPDRLRRFADTFGKMKRNGVRVSVPYDHSNQSRDNAGFIDDMKMSDDGRVLLGKFDVPLDEDRRRMGTTVREISAEITRDFVDGHGNQYGEAITHVSPVTNPVMPGQGNFVVMRMATDDGQQTNETETSHKETVMERLLAMLKKWLGLGEDASEAAIADALEKKVGGDGESEKKPADNKPADSGGGSDGGEPKQASIRPIAAGTPAVDANGVVTMSTGTPAKQVDSETMQLRARIAELEANDVDTELTKHLSRGAITPDIKNIAKPLLMCRSGNYQMSVTGGDNTNVAEQVKLLLSLIPDGAALDLDDRTKQLSVIGRKLPDDNAGPSDERAKQLAKENLEGVGQ